MYFIWYMVLYLDRWDARCLKMKLIIYALYASAYINTYVQFKIRTIKYDLNNLDIRRYIRIVQVRGVFFLICLDVTKFPLVMRVSYCSKSYSTSFIHIFFTTYKLRQINQCKNNEHFHWKNTLLNFFNLTRLKQKSKTAW